MNKVIVNGMKSSEILRIEAAVMEKAERISPDVRIDCELMPAKAEGKLMMTICFPQLSLDGLTVLREDLAGFSLDLFGKGKSGLFVSIVGGIDAFRKMISPVATRQQYQPSRS